MCNWRCSNNLFLCLLAILFPPIAVWVKRGVCSVDSVINILLCVLGFIPGLLHSWCIICTYPYTDSEYESLSHNNDGRVNYGTIRNGQHAQNPRHVYTIYGAPSRHAPMHYGPTVHAQDSAYFYTPYAAPSSRASMNYGTTVHAQNPAHFYTPYAPPSSRASMNYGTTTYAATAASRSQAQGYSVAGSSFGGGSASVVSVPPSYAEVVAGDHKIQH